LLTTITINRLSIITGCCFWFLIVGERRSTQEEDRENGSLLKGQARSVAFGVLMLVGIVETLSRRANVISIERDCVPMLAPPEAMEKNSHNNEEPSKYSLIQVNSAMARIDMLCELACPIITTWFFSVVESMRLAVAVVGILNATSIWIELVTARRLAQDFSALTEAKNPEIPVSTPSPGIPTQTPPLSSVQRALHTQLSRQAHSLRVFFSNDVSMPSFAMCLLHMLMLNISSTTVAFLLNSGYSLQIITVLEALGSSFELASTFVTPYAVGTPRRRLQQATDSETTPLLADGTADAPTASLVRGNADNVCRVGLWAISEMFVVLVSFHLPSAADFPGI
jgi:solute carrier family 40 (iron-regulated transporter), member 1